MGTQARPAGKKHILFRPFSPVACFKSENIHNLHAFVPVVSQRTIRKFSV